MHRTFVHIKTPCNVDFSNLRSAGKHRFCDDCNKVVYDLSVLSEAEACALLSGERRALCVRYLYDANGEVHFGDSPLIAPSALARRAPSAFTRGGKLAAAVLSAPLLFQACGGAGPESDWVPITLPPTASSSVRDAATGPASLTASSSAPALFAPLSPMTASAGSPDAPKTNDGVNPRPVASEGQESTQGSRAADAQRRALEAASAVQDGGVVDSGAEVFE